MTYNKEQRREYNRLRRTRLRNEWFTVNGTWTMAKNYKCKCKSCMIFLRDRQRQWRARQCSG